MLRIILTSEQQDVESIEVVVTNLTYKSILGYQYAGGFKRFGISIVDDKIKGRKQYSEKDKTLNFLKQVFLNTTTKI